MKPDPRRRGPAESWNLPSLVSSLEESGWNLLASVSSSGVFKQPHLALCFSGLISGSELLRLRRAATLKSGGGSSAFAGLEGPFPQEVTSPSINPGVDGNKPPCGPDPPHAGEEAEPPEAAGHASID